MSSLLYIPCASFNDEDVESLVQLSLSDDVHRVDTHGGRKAALKYLLNMHALAFRLPTCLSTEQVTHLQEKLHALKDVDLFKKEFDENGDQSFEPYWELHNDSSRIHPIAKNTRQWTNGHAGFAPEQLKVYFNRKQIENIPFSSATLQSAGFVDADARDNLLRHPLDQRRNQGMINTKQGRIEQAIFDVPKGKQIIILDFADERMPGGQRDSSTSTH